ncbi:MAG: hypothetical protein IKT38_02090 [Clostridia bacterium]|nr:hypothetical protein [Clostridia bacterium]
MNSKLKDYIAYLKSPKILIILGISGIILIFISSFFTGESKKKTEANSKTDIYLTEYRSELQKDICSMVADITGSRKVEAIVTLESSIKYSYADIKETNEAEKTDSVSESFDSSVKEGFITVKTADGGEEALLITEKMPEIRGVAIVCEGGDDEILNEKIKNAVTSAFDITEKRVYICGRKIR